MILLRSVRCRLTSDEQVVSRELVKSESNFFYKSFNKGYCNSLPVIFFGVFWMNFAPMLQPYGCSSCCWCYFKLSCCSFYLLLNRCELNFSRFTWILIICNASIDFIKYFNCIDCAIWSFRVIGTIGCITQYKMKQC